MAIDTYEKRASILSFGAPHSLKMIPVPSALVGPTERYHFAGLFFGLSSSRLVFPVFTLMRNTVVPSDGEMDNIPVGASGSFIQ